MYMHACIYKYIHVYVDTQLLIIFYLFRWSFTGQISSLCGFLYSNGTALTFANRDHREVITKPVDTTYASDVRFYLLFGKQILSSCTYCLYAKSLTKTLRMLLCVSVPQNTALYDGLILITYLL